MSLSRTHARPTLSGFISPCLPSVAPKPPRGEGWLHEIKHDGYRLMVRREGSDVRLFTRHGNDWSDRFPSVAMAAAMLPRCRSFMIDGEIAVCDAQGRAVFDLLRRGKRRKPDALLFAFDLIELDGTDLRRQPIEERKARLARLLARSGSIVFQEHIEGDGEIVFQHACQLGCEGIVSKRRGSSYQSGRSRHWLKSRNPQAPAARRLVEEDWR